MTITTSNLAKALKRTWDFLNNEGFGAPHNNQSARAWLDDCNDRPGLLSEKTQAALDILCDLGLGDEIIRSA